MENGVSLWFHSTPLFDLNFASVFSQSRLSLCKCPLIKNRDLRNAENDSFPQDSARNGDSQQPHDFSGRDQDQAFETGVTGEANYCVFIAANLSSYKLGTVVRVLFWLLRPEKALQVQS